MPCPHPSHRLYANHTYNVMTGLDDWLCIACCDCGAVLKGSAEDYAAAYTAWLEEIR